METSETTLDCFEGFGGVWRYQITESINCDPGPTAWNNFPTLDLLRSEELFVTFSWHVRHASSVGIDLKELGGGQLPKCLKFCPGIEI